MRTWNVLIVRKYNILEIDALGWFDFHQINQVLPLVSLDLDQILDFEGIRLFEVINHRLLIVFTMITVLLILEKEVSK